ncbi:MAG: transposase [Bacteroidales bacterium]|nr:transposase [Bacteroidales bacterium]
MIRIESTKKHLDKRPHTRSTMVRDPGMYHLYAKQVNGERIFYRQSDFKKLISTIEEARKKFHSDIIVVVCMSNHFHMIVNSPDIMGFKTFIARKYCGWYNVRHKRTGPLFYDSTIKASPIFYAEAQRDKILYNANNPVKANLCKSPFRYKYSSLKLFTKKPGIWKELIQINMDMILKLFGTLDDFRKALSAEIEYKKFVRG